MDNGSIDGKMQISLCCIFIEIVQTVVCTFQLFFTRHFAIFSLKNTLGTVLIFSKLERFSVQPRFDRRIKFFTNQLLKLKKREGNCWKNLGLNLFSEIFVFIHRWLHGPSL